MEPPPFWTHLKSQFLSLADHARDCHVVYDETPSEGRAAMYGQRVVDGLRHAGILPDGDVRAQPYQPYPTFLYHPEQPPRVLLDATAVDALRVADEWWRDRPYRHHSEEEYKTPENRAAKATLAREAADRVTAKRADGLADAIYVDARAAARAAADVLDGRPRRVRYALCNGPRDQLEREYVWGQFRAYAIRGACGADLVPPDASDDDAFDAWLQALREKRLGQEGIEGIVERPCHSSAALCEELATKAYRRVRAAGENPAGLPPDASPEQNRQERPGNPVEALNDGGEQSRARARHAFVNRQLAKSNLSILEWAQQSVPPVAYNTVRAYIDGKTRRLRPNTRTVLAKTLRVSPRELPE